MQKKLFLASFFVTVLLSACAVSLAEDVTPPPNYQSPTPPQAQAAPVSVQPLLPPDPTQGAAIYAEKCLPCHGVKGLGDGPQASKLGLPVSPVGSTTLARNARPADWYNLVTNGKMEKGMPPFRSLNDRQRWDVVAYTLTLSTSQKSLEQGKQIYDENCASCHGSTGRGDGSAASGSAYLSDWSVPGRLTQVSANDLVQVINTGAAPAMPSYSSRFSEDQVWALADYIRTFSFASGGSSQTEASAATPAATPDAAAQSASQATPDAQATAAPFTVSITGKVSSATGAPVPAGLKVTLQGYDNMVPTWSNSVDVQADGSYRFDDVEVISGRTFLATVLFQNVPFSSNALHAAELTAGQETSLPISLTEVTSDADALSVQRMHVFFDFSTPGMVQIAELFIVINSGNKAVVPSEAGAPAVLFSLPEGAQELSFQDGELGGRFVKTDQGIGDLTPIQPNEQLQVLFGYILPYTGEQSLSIPMTMPVESTVVMVPSGGVSVQSPQLIPAGERSVDGTNIQLFTANSLSKGSTLDVTLKGQPSGNVPAGAPGALSGTNEMVIGIGIFGVVLIAAGIWLYRQRRNNGKVAIVEEDEELELPIEMVESPEAILDAIVALDDLYQAGELPETAYQQRRAELKERLRQIREE